MTPPDAIAAFRRRHPLCGPGVVAVSGGADSVALLLALAECESRGLVVGHFHHQLRGADADADAAFVRELAASLGLPHMQGTAAVGAEAGNQEANARRLRYQWLAGVAREVGGGWVATGHTADDQAETVLFRLLRGSGVSGLRGIAPARLIAAQSAVRLVRPILSASRAGVLHYLESRGRPFRTDATNADRRFTRNRLRHDLLPRLAAEFPAAPHHLARLAEQAAELSAFVEESARVALGGIERPRAGGVALDVAGFAALPPVLQPEVVRLVWRREGWAEGAMTARHWRWASEAIRGERGGVDLPGGVHVRRRGAVAEMGPK